MKIYLIRHGQTGWNKEGIFRGRIDVGLDETGLEQAKATGEALRTVKIAAVYSSPLSRAVQTAEAVAMPHGLAVNQDDSFIDLNFGVWQGLSVKEVEARYPELYATWRKQPHKARFPEGEGLDEVRERAMAGLERLASTHPQEETIVIVSHRVVTKLILCAALGLDNSHFWQITQDTCCINLLEYTGGRYIIHLINDTCHLRGLSS